MRYAVIFTAIFIVFLQAQAHARGFDRSGAAVTQGGWRDQNHSSESFRALAKIQRPLRVHDYYYQVVIVNQMSPTFSGCTPPNTESMFRQLFGTSRMKAILVKLGIRYRLTNDSVGVFQDREVPLVFLGHNVDSAFSNKRGCFFQPANSSGLLLFRWDGASANENREDFQLTISVDSSESTEYRVVSRIKELFLKFNTAFSWTQISAGKVDAFNDAATKFEDAINAAGNSFMRNSREYILETKAGSAGRISIRVPGMVKSGDFVIYSRLVGSVFLDSRRASPETLNEQAIMGSKALATRACAKQILEKKACGDANYAHVTLASFLDAKDLILFDFTSPEGRKSVYRRCQRLRFFGTSHIELSNIDALILRWAALSTFQVQDRLNNPDEVTKLAAENNVSEGELVRQCWSADDGERLEKFLKELNYRL